MFDNDSKVKFPHSLMKENPTSEDGDEWCMVCGM